MTTAKYVYWEQDGTWLGYLQEYPDYWTQGESLDDLKAHLHALSRDLSDPLNRIGFAKGTFTRIAPDFDDPLPDSFWLGDGTDPLFGSSQK